MLGWSWCPGDYTSGTHIVWWQRKAFIHQCISNNDGLARGRVKLPSLYSPSTPKRDCKMAIGSHPGKDWDVQLHMWLLHSRIYSSRKYGLVALPSLTSTTLLVPVARNMVRQELVSASRHLPPFIPVPTGTDSVVYSVHVSVVCVAGACWVARSVLPQQMGMFVGRIKNACVLENSITWSAGKGRGSTLVVKGKGGIRPTCWGERVVLIAFCLMPGLRWS